MTKNDGCFTHKINLKVNIAWISKCIVVVLTQAHFSKQNLSINKGRKWNKKHHIYLKNTFNFLLCANFNQHFISVKLLVQNLGWSLFDKLHVVGIQSREYEYHLLPEVKRL